MNKWMSKWFSCVERPHIRGSVLWRMAVLPLAVSLLVSSISLDLSLTSLKGAPLTLLSSSRNITLSIVGNSLLADNIAVAHLEVGQLLGLSIRCLSDTSVYFSTSDSNALVHSPSLCSAANGLLINESSLYGCISNVYHGSKLLLLKSCGNGGNNPTPRTSSIGTLQPVYVAEPLEVNEGASIPLQWKNVYVLPEHSRLNISNKDILFSIVEGPHHGQLTLNGQPCGAFNYDNLLTRSVIYTHDGSETTQDSLDFQLEINNRLVDFPWLETTTYTLKIRINAVNDAPELYEAKTGQVIKISARGSRIFSPDLLFLSDPDDSPDKVRVQVIEGRGVHLRISNKTITEFTQRQFINRVVSIHDEGVFDRGLLRLVARDGEARSQVLTCHTVSTPIEVRLKTNTGIRLLHHSAALISQSNLSFSASVPDLPLYFSIVGLPDHGVVECSPDEGHFAVCSRFSQSQIEDGLVRFRHTSSNYPTHDMFSFQVESGDFVSMIHNFRIMFTPMNVKVFNREAFIINGTEAGTLSRSNLFAWTFPKSYPPNKLVYHIEEPPKYGILSRKVGKKNRRIGVSSNFTQGDIDNVLISYRLHFMQYSIVNDFFLFRVVSPAMSSESLRFEIIFVPTPTSIQLVNRTVVIQEGELTMITSDSLSLSTSDDKHFVFSITILPYHGSLLLKKNGGGKVALSQGSNFTTKDVEEGRVFYSHSGSETRSDRMYLTAESAFRKGRRIPFWVSFSIILLNDNLPRLDGSNVIQIVERGERILYPHLLKWTDDDSDSVPLEFNFHYPIKDAAILSTVSPYLPTTLFSQSDLMERKIMIRHLGHKRNVSINYSVNDGKHTVEGTLLLVASDPFVRVEESMLEYCCLPGDTPELSIGSSNLSVITNLDVKPEDIQYFASTNNFLLRTSNDKKIVRKFTQKDIDDGNMRYSVGKVENESLKIIIGNRTLQSEMHISRRSLGSSLELRRASTLNLPVGVAVIIDSLHLEQGDGVTEADRLWYHVVRQPQEGTLVLENEGNPVFPLLHVTRFSQQDVDRGRLQYIHGGGGSGRDTIEFNITSPHITKGPFILYLEIYEHHVSLNTSPLHVVSGESAVISITVINVTSSDKDDYVLKILQRPSYGWIVKDSWSMNNISSIESFTGADLRERRVVFVSDRETAAKSDWFSVIACISQDTCTSAKTVDVLLSQRNMQSPQLLRNEILRLSGDKALITNSHLDTEDPDTPSSEVFFLISRPSIGIVVDVNDQEKAIYNFSQRDIDDSNIIFVKNTNASGSGGFSFLISDSVHQIGPEWFSIESWSSSSPLLEANSRLMAPPDSDAIISIDLLRANLPNSRPEEVLFSITKHPKHGKILVNGKSSDKFSQNEINRKMVSYSSEGSTQHEWTRKDSFSFVISRNGSSRPVDDEFRFRILTTYAVLEDPTGKYVSVTPLKLSKGGSAPFNATHINIFALATVVDKEELLLEVGKTPRNGYLEWIDRGRNVMTWTDFVRESLLLYRHAGEDSRDDSVMFFIYPASETTRRTSRLRVTVPIRISTIRDPLVQIVHFPSSISVRNSGITSLSPDHFLASHPHVPPQSVVYEVMQNGRNGAEIKVDGQNKIMFSQEQINQGLVSIAHSPVPFSASSSDVVAFSVEGHSRVLTVRIKPLDLALENHTTIEYPQGKTYVVLNSSHLGVYSSGDRSKITYKVTSGPENGTFYWVAGEKEAKQFTQTDIDEGRILYAQLNMHSYKDSFEFVLGNEDRDIVRNRSDIVVRPLVDVQPVIVETDSATPITSSQLNASLLQGSTPRFLITSVPKYGRVSLDPSSNHSALFFTFPDILRGRVYYQAFTTYVEVTEHLELEVRADSVQPARLVLPITILPIDVDAEDRKEYANKELDVPIEVPRLSPTGDQLPVIILVIILFITVCVLLCRKRPNKKPSMQIPTTPPRLPPTPRSSLPMDKPDLLDSTVFASVGRSEPRPPMKTFDRVQVTPTNKRRHQPSLDYAGMGVEAPPQMPLFKQLAAQKSDTQYWV